MKNIFKYMSMALLAISAAAVVSSCTDEDDDWTPGENADGPNAYFTETSYDFDLSTDDSSISISVCRLDDSGSYTVPIDVDGADGSIYTVPTSVTFSDGVSEVELVITFDPDDLVYDDFAEITLTIDEECASPYASSTTTVTAGMPSPWTSLGYATYTDDFITTFYDVDNVTYEVEIEENDLNPGYYRLVNPYGEAYPYNETYDDGTADWDTSQDWYLYIHAEDPEGVYILPQETGLDWGYGNTIVCSYGGYYISYGYTVDDIKDYGYAGTLADGVITFPTNTLLICMPDYSSYYYYANSSGAFMVVLPGYIVADYSVEVAYTGKFTDAGDADYVIATVTLGEDVEYVNVGVFSGSSISDDQLQSVIDGTATPLATATASGTVSLSAEGFSSGYYTLVAVSYDSDGNAQEYATVKFLYTASGDSYIDPLILDYSLDEIDYDLEPDSRDGYYGSYSVYAKSYYYYDEEDTRELLSTGVTISDGGTDSDGWEYVDMEGFWGDIGEYWEIEDLTTLEYYYGELYFYNNSTLGEGYGGYYYSQFTYSDDGTDAYIWGSSYDGYGFMIYAPVYEGYYALIDLYAYYGYTYNFCGIALTVCDSSYSTIYGYGDIWSDIMLVAEDADTSAMDIAIKNASLIKARLSEPRANFVETGRGYIHSVIQNVKAEQAAVVATHGSFSGSQPISAFGASRTFVPENARQLQ